MKFIENIKITKLGHGGIGIATYTDGRKILIKGGPLPGSIVDIRIVKSKADHIEGHITKIHYIDPEYTDGEILCPHYIYDQSGINTDEPAPERPPHKTGCGGCKRQIINYNKQLLIKKQLVEESFDIINRRDKSITCPQEEITCPQEDNYPQNEDKSNNSSNIYISETQNHQIKILNPIPSPKIRGYRNKIEFSFGKYIVKNERLSEWSAGFHKQGEFAKIVDIDQCFLIDNKLNSVYKYLKNILKETGFDVYDQKFHRGVFRHLMLRQGQNTDEIMAVLALSNKYISSPNDILRIKEILKSNEFLNQHITTMVLVINNGLGDIMFAPDSILENLRGNGYIYETLNINDESLKFKISPQSFFQTNTSGAQVLFETGINILKSKLADKGGLLIDLYCGAGTIGLSMMAGGMFDKVIGVDIVKSSIDDAIGNAAANNMSDKSEFHCGKAEDIVKKLDKINNLKAIVIDPPREGLHPDVIKFLIDLKHKQDYKLLYISCNPVTMARDISMLLDSGKFFTDTIQPMDMFPHTHHIENISILD